MRTVFSNEIESGRDTTHQLYRTKRGDRCGFFKVPCPLTGMKLRIMVSAGDDWHAVGMPGPAWEHVSVSTPVRVPTWEEMCWVKDQFWLPEELVLQFHPPHSRYVNIAKNCLHLWRPVGVDLPMPPIECV